MFGRAVLGTESDMADLVVVGGGAAGHACVAAYRERGGRGSVELLTDEDVLPYFRPHLTKELLTGEVPIGEIGLDQAAWYRANDIQVRLACTATEIDVTKRLVVTDTGAHEFESLVLATGSSAARLPVPGADADRVITIRTAQDAASVLGRIESGAPVLVVGSGFVGCEAAASLAVRGLDVTMVTDESSPQAARLGDEAAALIAAWLHDLGVVMRPSVSVERFEHGPGSTRVVLGDGSALECGWVVAATGASPNVALAATAGLVDDGAVPVDASMRTAVPQVFAVGDIAAAFNPAAGRRLRVEHWGEAERMGAIAGTVLAGGDDAWEQVPGFWSSIGGRQLKYAAWGDGWDRSRAVASDGGLTVWYGRDGEYVGVLTHDHDDDLEAGKELVRAHARFE